MFLTIPDILTSEIRRTLLSELASVRWQDGSQTAGPIAREVKSNQQADLSSRAGVKIRDRLTQAITTHPVLTAAAQPHKFSKILVSKTEAGGSYGRHIDNPHLKSGADQLRTDLSYTLFLSDPSDYAGGELRVETAGETKRFKPPAGTLILYPTRFLHEVTPVREGVRLVCIGWIESRIRQASHRDILFDLENLSSTLSAHFDGQSEIMLTLAKVITNLKRDLS